MASASSIAEALGICSPLAGASEKIGLTRRVHPGQIAGATDARLARRMPATNVPCAHAGSPASAHAADSLPGTSRMFSAARSGLSSATGPSISPIGISGLPLVRAINRGSPTRSKQVTRALGWSPLTGDADTLLLPPSFRPIGSRQSGLRFKTLEEVDSARMLVFSSWINSPPSRHYPDGAVGY